MANTCSFGQIKDGRFRSICVNGKDIINGDLNLKCIKAITAQTACINTVEINKLTEKGESDCVVINRSIKLNPHGVGRIFVNSPILWETSGSYIVDVGSSEISFETYGPSTLLLNGHHFTTPSVEAYTNECLTSLEWCALVQVDIQLKIANEFDDFGQYEVRLIKNDEDVVSKTCVYASGEEYETRTVSLCDTVECNPSDTLDIYIQFEGVESSIEILSGSEFSHATFKIVGLKECTLD